MKRDSERQPATSWADLGHSANDVMWQYNALDEHVNAHVHQIELNWIKFLWLWTLDIIVVALVVSLLHGSICWSFVLIIENELATSKPAHQKQAERTRRSRKRRRTRKSNQQASKPRNSRKRRRTRRRKQTSKPAQTSNTYVLLLFSWYFSTWGSPTVPPPGLTKTSNFW